MSAIRNIVVPLIVTVRGLNSRNVNLSGVTFFHRLDSIALCDDCWNGQKKALPTCLDMLHNQSRPLSFCADDAERRTFVVRL